MTDERLPAVSQVAVEEEVRKSFLEYAMSVIVSRALPDVRDGLKPVHRRILYAMSEAGMRPGSPYKKCARVVGDVMAKYHPHSNDAIYDALVRLGQDFASRYPLVDGQGNFGSVDDPPAAMRYCVTGDTLIATTDGTVPIAELAEVRTNSEVEIDVKVLDRRGHPVRATRLFHSGLHPTLRLRTREGFELAGTHNHPILCLVPVAGVPMLLWKLLEEIEDGERVVMRLDDRTSNEIPFVTDYLEAENRSEEALRIVQPLLEAGYHYATVSSVEDLGVRPVYSIRVDSDDHSFLGNGFVNHNTECRLESLAMELLEGIDEDTVDFVDNYDGSEQEPEALPSRFPNLLVNGGTGIAVGMATNIPPHNLGEVIDAAIHVVDHPDATPEELMQFVKGPDFPTGGYIMGAAGIREAYLTGRGSIKMRAVADVEELRKGRTAIIVREIPYQVSKDRIMEKIAQLVRDKKITGISDLRDESDREGTRLVIELKQNAIPQVVLNQLYKNTQLQENFAANIIALVDGVPRTLDLAEALGYYVDHQMEVVERRTRHRLQRAKDRAHVVEGLLVALDNIDEVVAIIRRSDDTAAARTALVERFELSEIQANHILEMPLRRLTALETSKLREEHEELLATIADLEDILADPVRRRRIIADELAAIRERHADPRRSRIIPDDGELALEDLIADEDLVVTVSANGYVKSVLASSYRRQTRGGRGVKAAELRADDAVTHVIHTTAHAYLLFFTNTGRVHRVKAHELPRMDRTAKGVLAQSVLPLEADERIEAVVDTRDYETARYLVMVTRLGQVKKTRFSEYDSRSTSLIAINLQEGDEVVAVRTTNGENDLVIFTRQGMGIRFSEDQIRPTGRSTQGVRGIKLREGDQVVAAASDVEGDEVLLLTSRGYGKRTAMSEFPRQNRAGMGVKAIRLGPSRGELVGARAVSSGCEIFVVSSAGIVIRTGTDSISRQKRGASGVKVMNLPEGREVSAFALVVEENGEA